MIKISSPIVGNKEYKAIKEVLNSGNISQGKKVEEFENNFSRYIGSKYATAVSSGTAALYLSLLALGIKKGDEVITTTFSFIASSNAILYCQATPVFVDINPETFNIDPDKIEEKITSKTKAIIVVHLFGLPADMIRIKKITKKYKISIVEDACQAHGAMIGDKKVGILGDIGCFSFYPTKNMTTAEGGIVVTNNKRINDHIRLLRNHGMKRRYEYKEVGFNLRMTDIHAAIGIIQLRTLDMLNQKRIDNADYLTKNLSNRVECPIIAKGYKHVFHQFTIKIPKKRELFQTKLTNLGIENVVYYPRPLHKEVIYRNFINPDLKLPIAEKISGQVLSIPVHPSLTKNDLKYIKDSIIKTLAV